MSDQLVRDSLLNHLAGKSPVICFANLYAAVYVVARQMIDEEFPVNVMINTINDLQDKVVKELNSGR